MKFEFKLKKILRKQLKYKNKIVYNLDKKQKILIPYIESSHYQFFQILILAKALQLRGAEVKILLCNSFLEACELKSIKNISSKDPCLKCKFNQKHIVPLFNIKTIYLSDFITKEDYQCLKEIADITALDFPLHYYYKDIDIIPMVNDSVTRFYYGSVPTDNSLLIEIRRQNLLTAMMNIIAAEKIHNTWAPDIILNNMFVYSPWQPYYEYYKKNTNSKIFKVSITQFNYKSIILNDMDLYFSDERYLKYLEYRKGKSLNKQESGIIKEFIKSRMNGESDVFKELNFFDGGESKISSFVFDKNKRNLFLFSNIYWDVGMTEFGQLFKDVIDWVIQTVEIVKNSKNIHLYIKTHPGEKYDTSSSLKCVDDFIKDRFLIIPDNITLILPDQKIRPYELFPYIDLGIVFNGTIGLEMLLNGIPVIITGKAPYGRKGFASEPKTLEEYKKIILGEIAPIYPIIDEVELFAYFYFIKTCIPWNLTKRAYADTFKGYSFESLEDILPGKNRYLDHICNCILDSENTVIEGWE